MTFLMFFYLLLYMKILLVQKVDQVSILTFNEYTQLLFNKKLENKNKIENHKIYTKYLAIKRVQLLCLRFYFEFLFFHHFWFGTFFSFADKQNCWCSILFYKKFKLCTNTQFKSCKRKENAVGEKTELNLFFEYIKWHAKVVLWM